ncbi:MAG: tetratricopeptide repeat protein [Chloroflexia bacterium]|nr:tetratricopeptide repeat protein [Chloroflexia bacterium]
MDHFRRQEASEHYERAITLERAGRIDEALVEYRRAVDADPGFAEAYEALGHHYRQRGLLTKSLDAFRTVSGLEETFDAHFRVGYILLELGRFEEALTVFQTCLALEPEDPTALYQIAYTHYALGRLPQALEALRLPLEAYRHDGQVHSLMAACHLGLGDWAAAEQYFRQAIEWAPSPEHAAEAEAGLRRALRYQEFPDQELGLKERMYADFGVVLLGTAGDNGLEISLETDTSFAVEMIARTLSRLQELLAALPLDLTAVVSVERDSIPLALALEHLLRLPRRRLSQLHDTDQPLLVLAWGRSPELLQITREQAPPQAISFVLGLTWSADPTSLPDLTGVVLQGQGGMPWQDIAQCPEPDALAAEQILAACRQLAPDPNLEQQLAYYTARHRRLRFLSAI